MILLADGLHNLIGGLAVGGAILVDLRVGLITWLVAAAHEVPQELGDFGVLVHSGWRRRSALAWNVVSASTFLIGSLIAYGLAAHVTVAYLVPFAAGNFVYIAAADLLPEITRTGSTRTEATRNEDRADHTEKLVTSLAFFVGLAVLLAATQLR